MPARLKRLDLIKERCSITFVEVDGTGTPQIREVTGKLEKSSEVSLYGCRFRFIDSDGRNGNIGMIFPRGANSQFGEKGVNRVYRKGNELILKFAVKRCPGTNGCCQPWNNYIRYFTAENGH